MAFLRESERERVRGEGGKGIWRRIGRGKGGERDNRKKRRGVGLGKRG